MMTSQQIQYGGLPPYWKSSFDYIWTIYFPINAKFGTKKHNHVQTQVTWPEHQISKIQNGRRPPFWKWFYRCISAGNHPIWMKFWCADTNVGSKKVTCQRKYQNFANSKWRRPPCWKPFFSYISTIFCPINAKFGVRKHNHVQTQVT